MQLFSIITYHALAWRAWSIHSKAAKNRFSDISAVQARWVRNFVLASLAVCVVITLAIYFMFVHFPRLNNIRFLFVALTVFIYWISYSAMSQPAAFSIAEPVERTENIVASLSPRLVVHRSSRKYTNSGLHGEEMAAIQTTLQKIMSEQKPYLDPNLTINDLAARVQCNRHHLSQVLNESMRCSFYDFVNQYRVEEAKQLLLDSARENHKIASVAYDSGFNSLSTFNEVFKKMTGGTPSRFRKEVKDMPGQQAG
jgi:AraC-like DNA-binding protein